MECEYPVIYQNSCVGYVRLQKDNLYYQIECVVDILEKAMLRLIAQSGDIRLDLGLLMPKGNSMSLSKRIPIKNLNHKEITFELIGHKQCCRFVAVRKDKHFAYLQSLNNAYFKTMDGVPCIYWQD